MVSYLFQCRALKGELDKAAKVAKLFAKHFKIEQQIQYLQEKPLHIGVGTPNRIRVLTEEGKLGQVQHLSLGLIVLVRSRSLKDG